MTGIVLRSGPPSSLARVLNRLGIALLLAFAVPLMLPSVALAQHHGQSGGQHVGGGHAGGTHDGRWHGGGWHGGGWPVGVGVGIGLWAPYYWGWPWWGWPYDVYDYPPPVTYVYPSQTTIQQPVATPTQTGFWYYCDNPRGYYPYVQTCSEAWRPVPATPPPSPPQ